MFRIPPVTGWLIAINVLVHVVRLFLAPGQDEAVLNSLGFDPSNLYRPIGVMTILSLVTYQFLHGGWDHLAVNMVSLLAFGAGVEKPLGPIRYLVLYLFSGIAGALLEAAFTAPGAQDQMIGASASISGVFGALLIIWGVHRSGKRPLGLLPMLLLWIALMAVTGITGLGAQGAPVAWIAHIGGFLAGVAFGFAFRASPRPAG
jgi:membrane associated rhomboid family serine protease